MLLLIIRLRVATGTRGHVGGACYHGGRHSDGMCVGTKLRGWLCVCVCVWEVAIIIRIHNENNVAKRAGQGIE